MNSSNIFPYISPLGQYYGKSVLDENKLIQLTSTLKLKNLGNILAAFENIPVGTVCTVQSALCAIFRVEFLAEKSDRS